MQQCNTDSSILAQQAAEEVCVLCVQLLVYLVFGFGFAIWTRTGTQESTNLRQPTHNADALRFDIYAAVHKFNVHKHQKPNRFIYTHDSTT